jgi:hypothetical protein
MDTFYVNAASHNLEPVSRQVSAFLQYEISLLIIKGQIHIYVHVTLVNRKLLLELLRFNNAPTQISKTLALQQTPPAVILAIGLGWSTPYFNSSGF